MISRAALKIAAECILGKRQNMRDLAVDANQYKVYGNQARKEQHEEYQRLVDAWREIEAELAQGRMEI